MDYKYRSTSGPLSFFQPETPLFFKTATLATVVV